MDDVRIDRLMIDDDGDDYDASTLSSPSILQVLLRRVVNVMDQVNT